MRRGIAVHWAIAAGLVASAAEPARAALSKDACDALKAERAQLVATDIPQVMEKGPEWAKANATADKLAQIQRFIEISEQIAFRCDRLQAVKPRIEQAETEPKPPEAADAATDDAVAAPTPALAPTIHPAPAPPSKRTEQKAAPPQQPAAEAPAAKPKPKPAAPKPRPNDAYSPPPGQPAGLGGLDAQAGKIPTSGTPPRPAP